MAEPERTLERTSEAFEKWCGITIIDAVKAPKATALKQAYWHAWQASARQNAGEIAARLETTANELESKFGKFEPSIVLVNELRRQAAEIRKRYEAK